MDKGQKTNVNAEFSPDKPPAYTPEEIAAMKSNDVVTSIESPKTPGSFEETLDDSTTQTVDRARTELESDKNYQEVTKQIIDISKTYLFTQQKEKINLRKRFFNLFSWLICVQFIFIVLFILFDSCPKVTLEIPDETLKVYIVSVFLETLTAIGTMIAFAFASKEETRIVGVLNSIVENYQKFRLGSAKNSSISPNFKNSKN